MSWTQVHISGLPADTNDIPDDEIEQALSLRYTLENEAYTWAGAGTTIVKRGASKYCFLVFFTTEGADLAVSHINNNDGCGGKALLETTSVSHYTLPVGLRLCAAISQPKKQKKSKKQDDPGSNHSQLRMRRMRAAPSRKHPIEKRKNCVGSSGEVNGRKY